VLLGIEGHRIPPVARYRLSLVPRLRAQQSLHGVGVTLSSKERASAKRELLVLSASVGIGRQSLDLGVAFGKRSVLARELEETGLKVGLSGIRRRTIFEASRVVFDCEWPYQHRVRRCCGREHELTARKLPSQERSFT